MVLACSLWGVYYSVHLVIFFLDSQTNSQCQTFCKQPPVMWFYTLWDILQRQGSLKRPCYWALEWGLWEGSAILSGERLGRGPTRAGQMGKTAAGQGPWVWGSTVTGLKGAESAARSCAKQRHSTEGLEAAQGLADVVREHCRHTKSQAQTEKTSK